MKDYRRLGLVSDEEIWEEFYWIVFGLGNDSGRPGKNDSMGYQQVPHVRRSNVTHYPGSTSYYPHEDQ